MQQPALLIENLQKRYGSTVALADLSLACAGGEVHALLGENGAGKSTLVKVLSGLVQPDGGRLALDGQSLPTGSPSASRNAGIATAFQEISLVKDLTVAENFLLGTEPLDPLGMVRRRKRLERVEAALAKLGVSGIDPQARVRDLDLPARQKIEIARAMAREPRILLLDEPTASLSARDVQWLGDRLSDLRARGTAVLFISHRLPEVRAFCDRITILRNGRDVASCPTAEMSDEEIVRQTIGRSLEAIFPPPGLAAPADDAPLLETRALSAGKRLHDVSLALRPGTITGVGALEGMGQRDLFLALFGLEETTGGEILVRGTPVAVSSPADAIDAGIGISLVPEDRKTEGLFLALDGAENATLPQLSRYARFGLVDRRQQASAAEAMFRRIDLADRALWSPAGTFSGGNQQKIVLAKWLLTGARILLLYDPTRGIDVGAKAEIFKLMRAFTEKGGAILFYSTEIMELAGMSDEVITLYRGRVADRLSGEAITETAIMASALGQRATGGADGNARAAR